MTIIDENEIARCVRRAVEDYLKDLDGEKPHPLYGMVINSVEKPLVELVMKYSEGKPDSRCRVTWYQPKYSSKQNKTISNQIKGELQRDR